MAHGDGIIGYPGHGVGLRNVGSYQVSGEPWISGSSDQADDKVKRFEFPYVTRELTVYNYSGGGADGGTGQSNTIRVHFSSGSGHDFSSADIISMNAGSTIYSGLHYVSVAVGSSVTFKAKAKEVYVTSASGSASFRVLADLTNIPTARMYHLTGSGLTD
jgi:hypothetical protein